RVCRVCRLVSVPPDQLCPPRLKSPLDGVDAILRSGVALALQASNRKKPRRFTRFTRHQGSRNREFPAHDEGTAKNGSVDCASPPVADLADCCSSDGTGSRRPPGIAGPRSAGLHAPDDRRGEASGPDQQQAAEPGCSEREKQGPCDQGGEGRL